MRGLVLLAIVVVIGLAVWSLRGGVRGLRTGQPTVHHDRLVKDPVCRTYVVTARATRREVGGELRYFCSPECAGRYAAEADGEQRRPEDRRGERRA